MSEDKMIHFRDGEEIILTYERSEQCPNPWGEGDALMVFCEEGVFVSTSIALRESLVNQNISAGNKFSIKRWKTEGKKKKQYTKYEIIKL